MPSPIDRMGPSKRAERNEATRQRPPRRRRHDDVDDDADDDDDADADGDDADDDARESDRGSRGYVHATTIGSTRVDERRSIIIINPTLEYIPTTTTEHVCHSR